MKFRLRIYSNVLCCFFGSLLIVGCALEMRSTESGDKKGNEVSIPDKDKQRGAHVFGRIDTTNLQFLSRDHIEWVTLVPWGFQESIDSPEVLHHRGDSARIRRRNEHWIRQIRAVRNAGFKVFVKPHIWMDTPPDGKWRSDIFPKGEDNWKQWQTTYRNFILRYARLAEEAGAEMFCVGTELTRLTLEKPSFWQDLIVEIREVYSGKLTYAANWYEEYEGIKFWEQLDYVGVQAYFPLSDHESPDMSEIVAGWNQHLPVLEKVSRQSGRPILFTELGYKSTSNSAMKPWEWMDYADMDEMKVSYETQSYCYKAFFNSVWSLPWFAGVHLWQYRQDHEAHAHELTHDFTPQGKPAQLEIGRGFSNGR